MFMYIIFILFCWFVKMPLWLSVVGTVFSGLGFISKCVEVICNKLKD